jgi:hypothetical protein
VALGGVCARFGASHYGSALIAAGIGAPVLLLIAQRPGVAVLALLAILASTFEYGTLPRVSLPGHPPINVADLVLAAAVGGTLWRRPWRGWPTAVKRYALAIVVVLLLAGVATVKTSLLGATHTREALLAYRNFLYLLVAVTIAVELTGSRWRRTLDVAVAFGGIVSILAIVAAASPNVAHFLQTLSPTTVYTSAATSASGGVNLGSTARIRLPGLFFIYSMLLPTLVMILTVRDRWRLPRVLALLLMLAAVGLSLNRNMYAGALVGLLVTALVGGAKVRFRIAMLLAAVVVAIVLIVTSSVAPAVTSQIGKRASTVVTPSQILKSNSLKDRTYELAFALPEVARHPWFGIGPRQFYGAYINRPGGTPRFYVQNLYVDFALDYGIPTALAFLLVPGICLWFGFVRLSRATDAFQRGMLAAGIGTLVALLLSCFVDTFVQDPSTTVALGISCGLLLAAGLSDGTIESKGAI